MGLLPFDDSECREWDVTAFHRLQPFLSTIANDRVWVGSSHFVMITRTTDIGSRATGPGFGRMSTVRCFAPKSAGERAHQRRHFGGVDVEPHKPDRGAAAAATRKTGYDAALAIVVLRMARWTAALFSMS